MIHRHVYSASCAAIVSVSDGTDESPLYILLPVVADTSNNQHFKHMRVGLHAGFSLCNIHSMLFLLLCMVDFFPFGFVIETRLDLTMGTVWIQ